MHLHLVLILLLSVSFAYAIFPLHLISCTNYNYFKRQKPDSQKKRKHYFQGALHNHNRLL